MNKARLAEAGRGLYTNLLNSYELKGQGDLMCSQDTLEGDSSSTDIQ